MKKPPDPDRLTGQQKALRRKVIRDTGRLMALPPNEAGLVPMAPRKRSSRAVPGLAEMAEEQMKRVRRRP